MNRISWLGSRLIRTENPICIMLMIIVYHGYDTEIEPFSHTNQIHAVNFVFGKTNVNCTNVRTR